MRVPRVALYTHKSLVVKRRSDLEDDVVQIMMLSKPFGWKLSRFVNIQFRLSINPQLKSDLTNNNKVLSMNKK